MADMVNSRITCGATLIQSLDSKHDSCHADQESKNLHHVHYAGSEKQIECVDKNLRQKYKLPLPAKNLKEKVKQACGDSKSSGREL